MLLNKDFFNLQVNFAIKTAHLAGLPLDEAVRMYTGIPRNLNFPHSDAITRDPEWQQFAETLNASSDPRSTAYEFYQARLDVPFEHEPRDKFGCFACHVDREGLVRIHFSNKDDSGTGPLSRHRMPQRMVELTDMFGHVKQTYPDANLVGGFSWLYNIPAYTRLFPQEYGASGKSKEWYRSLALWGQFLDSSGNLKTEPADGLLSSVNCITSATEIPKCFPYISLEVRCPVDQFYQFYNLQ